MNLREGVAQILISLPTADDFKHPAPKIYKLQINFLSGLEQRTPKIYSSGHSQTAIRSELQSDCPFIVQV